MNPVTSSATLSDQTRMGAATLAVADLQRSLDFYQAKLGFHLLQSSDHSATIGAPDAPLLHLQAIPGAVRQPRHSTGLFHAAILLPSRHDLGRFVLHLHAQGVHFGFADHLVSEAFYFDDPDDNGLEVYRDRPRSEWKWENDTVAMANAPIDFDRLLQGIRPGEWQGIPAGTTIGHMHLRVHDLAAAEAFYVDLLGFSVAARWPGALFIAAGGYHHHLGLNTWQSEGAPPPPATSVGLRESIIHVGGQQEIERLAGRLGAARHAFERAADGLTLRDPSSTALRLLP